MIHDGQHQHGHHTQLEVDDDALYLMMYHFKAHPVCKPDDPNANVCIQFIVEDETPKVATVVCGNCGTKLGPCKVKKYG